MFALLTNAYCLVSESGCENFYSAVTAKLGGGGRFPVVRCSVSGVRTVGRLCAGNRKGLLVPETASASELAHLRNSLPEGVLVRRLAGPHNALGSVIVCNDHVALVHPELGAETAEAVGDALQVEVFRQAVAQSPLVGAACALSNVGALLHPATGAEEQRELSALLQVPVVAGTVNRGSALVGTGLVVNDWAAICGLGTTPAELVTVETVFGLRTGDRGAGKGIAELRNSLIDEIA